MRDYNFNNYLDQDNISELDENNSTFRKYLWLISIIIIYILWMKYYLGITVIDWRQSDLENMKGFSDFKNGKTWNIVC